MKSFSQVFLLSFVYVSAAFTMEVASVRKKTGAWFVEFNNDELEYHVGNNVCYGDKYRAQKLQDCNIVLFPVKATEGLPIRYCGNIRYFVTYANSKKNRKAYMISDDTIKQLVFVQGITESNGYGFDLYMGLKTDQYVSYNNGDRIYPASMMCILVKERNYRYVDISQRYVTSKKIKCFDGCNIKLEIAQNLLPERIDYKDPRYKAKARELLGDLVKNFNFETEKLVFSESCWKK